MVPPHFVEKLNFRQQSVNIAFENEYTDLRHGKEIEREGCHGEGAERSYKGEGLYCREGNDLT